jgi:hypothetical protein
MKIRPAVALGLFAALLVAVAVDYIGMVSWSGTRTVELPTSVSEADDSLRYEGYFRHGEAEQTFEILTSGDREFIELWMRSSRTAPKDGEQYIISLRIGGTESGLGLRNRSHGEERFIVWDGHAFQLFTVVDGEAEPGDAGNGVKPRREER